jgi:hypothetical protein
VVLRWPAAVVMGRRRLLPGRRSHTREAWGASGMGGGGSMSIAHALEVVGRAERVLTCFPYHLGGCATCGRRPAMPLDLDLGQMLHTRVWVSLHSLDDRFWHG